MEKLNGIENNLRQYKLNLIRSVYRDETIKDILNQNLEL